MAFHPFEVDAPHLAYALLGGFVVLFGMFSLVIKERLYIGEAPIATIVGIVIGPYCLKLFDPYNWGGPSQAVTDEITLEVTRVVIAIGVFAVGVELPKAYMRKHWRSLFFLLGPCMVYGWMVSALLIWGLIPGLNFLSSLVIAACVTPTDPILAQAVVGGKFADKHVPAHIRHLLSAESGSNDGAAFPFLYIALYLTLDDSTEHAVGEWFYATWLYEIALGIVLGSLLGWSARKVMKFSENKRLIDRQSFVAQYVSLAILSIGMCTLLGSDDLLAAFACGCAFAWDGFFNKATEDAVFSNVIDLLFNCAAFIYIGAIIPFSSFGDTSINLSVWRLVVLAILILIIRRVPIILALYKFIPDIKTFREAAFTGWFGPMGVGAIFISTLARTNLPEPHEGDTSQVALLHQTIGPIVAFLVLSSVLSHGLSIPFFSLSRRVHSITYTWSRNASMEVRDNEPAWTTHARRIQPGQNIVINRDDDDDGDLGNGFRRPINHRSMQEKNGERTEDESGSSASGSRTGAAVRAAREGKEGGEYELSEKIGERHHGRERSNDSAGISQRPKNSEGGVNEGGEGSGGENDGRRTPPLAEYREGHHLIVERRGTKDEEVEVEVIRNYFHDSEPTESDTFVHPHRLKNKELTNIKQNLPSSLERARLSVEEGGKHAIDRLGLGLMRSHSKDREDNGNGGSRQRLPSPEHRRRASSRSSNNSASSSLSFVGGMASDDAFIRPTALSYPQAERGSRGGGGGLSLERTTRYDPDDDEDDNDTISDAESNRVREPAPEPSQPPSSVIHTRIPAIRIRAKETQPSGWRRFIPGGHRGSSLSEPTPSQIEEGRSSVRPHPQSLPRAQPPRSSLLSPSLVTSSGASDDRSLQLTRTSSARAIRFAPELAESSETAPGGLMNYGNSNPGFRKTPGLALTRTTSIQSTNSQREGPSVSFKEPEKR